MADSKLVLRGVADVLANLGPPSGSRVYRRLPKKSISIERESWLIETGVDFDTSPPNHRHEYWRFTLTYFLKPEGDVSEDDFDRGYDVLDQAIAAFDARTNRTLGGVVNNVKPRETADVTGVADNNGDQFRVFVLNIEALRRVNHGE